MKNKSTSKYGKREDSYIKRAAGFAGNIKAVIVGVFMVFRHFFRAISMLFRFLFSGMGQMRDQFLSLFRFNITFKLTLGFAWIMFLFVNIFNFALILSIRNIAYENEVDGLRKSVDLVIAEFQYESMLEDRPSYSYLSDNGVEFAVVDEESNILYSNGFSGIDKVGTIPDYSHRYFDLRFPKWIYRKIRIQDSITIVFRSYMGDSVNMLQKTFAILSVVSLMLYVLAIALAQRMSKKHLKPIKTMTNKVMHISSSDLSTRLDIRGTKDELKDLASTFNKMMDDIESSYEKQKQFVSDASHELRTPIAVIKGYANMLSRWGKTDEEILEESITAIKDEADGMQSLVESLLFIARSDKDTLKMEKEDFNISELVEEIARQTKLIDGSHVIEESIQDSCTIYGSAEKLKQAIRIFVDNSIRYTPDGEKIGISLKSTSRDVIISISDTGIGISKDDMAHVFERFYRADKSRTRLEEDKKSSGSGLGLAIAKIIVDSHSGMVHVESEIDVGTCFTIIIPKTSA
ncbi:Signal transduction histidine kinase [Peptoclostridium litorale DSM 5388]|uniref:histidine kinase n=1 Tax=Peptoclostridium litorale DSM 5388 TaxID=1121324 RepID=A0A069RIS7_PEPLI|nr:HAMP domain-containing sensor histidine kinase [Peptoclostridium litorale]KDR96688.1 signal transduction histidine-protein kinase ArlS [Peptoclostridium litorale DSM 5388]SIN67716.1 Signal transduction histidine kinase [Peptoclostridium litorale DSM 5388]